MSKINDFVIEDGVLKKYIGTDSEVVVPDGVTKIEKRAFEKCASIVTVDIPDSVTELGEAVFSNCSSLKIVKISNSVTSISKWAFDNCMLLEQVKLPPILQVIGVCAFRYCKALKNIELPEGLKIIAGSAFQQCESLGGITIPDSVINIGEWAFLGCAALKDVKMGNGVVDIGYVAFGRCSSIVEIIVGKSVTRIGDRIFNECTELKKVVLPDSLSEVGETPFEKCTALRSIVLSNSSPLCENGAPWWKKNFNEKLLPIIALDNFDKNKKLTKYVLKDLVSTLEALLEYGRYDLISKILEFSNKISIDDLDKMINSSYEKSNTEAASLLLEYKNQKYPSSAIERIETVKTEKELGIRKLSVEDIKKLWTYRVDDDGYVTLKAYKGDETTPTIPEKVGNAVVRRIASGAFEWNRTVQKIYIPNGIIAIGDNVFDYVASLKYVEIPESVIVAGSNLFKNSPLVEVIPDLTSRSVENADSASLIEYDYCRLDTFNSEWEYTIDEKKKCCRLETYTGGEIDVYIPDSIIGFPITEIGAQCFNSSTVCQKQRAIYRKIESVRLPETVTKIGRAAFFECLKLREINIPKGCCIEESAFKHCRNLAENKLIIFNDVLHSCVETGSAKYKITVPDGVKEIASNAFENCHCLKEIKIPETVISIGKNAFSYCESLLDIYYAGSEEEWKKVSEKANVSKKTNIHFILRHTKF